MEDHVLLQIPPANPPASHNHMSENDGCFLNKQPSAPHKDGPGMAGMRLP